MHSPKKRLPTRARRRQPVTGGRKRPRGGHRTPSCGPPGNRPGCGSGRHRPDWNRSRLAGHRRHLGQAVSLAWVAHPLLTRSHALPRLDYRPCRGAPTEKGGLLIWCDAPCRRSGSRCSCRGLSFRKQVIRADGAAGRVPNSGNQPSGWRLPSKLDARQRCLCRPGLIGQRVQRQAAFTTIGAKSVFHAAKLHWA